LVLEVVLLLHLQLALLALELVQQVPQQALLALELVQLVFQQALLLLPPLAVHSVLHLLQM
jgi:hypothetical protein